MPLPAQVVYANLDKYRRAIVFSDLHGDADGFRAMLKQVSFDAGDALICVGDLLEKGDASLPLLRAVMELSHYGHVYAVAGNNDILLPDWEEGRISDLDIHRYMAAKTHTVLREMALELGMGWESIEQVQTLKAAISEQFAPELAFLKSMPHILETPHATFVHAGLSPGPLTQQSRDRCLTWNAFGKQPFPFAKRVIVGHWPASNYREHIVCVDPYENKATGVVSIDGGNNLNRWGQINYLVLQGTAMSFGRLDHHPKVRALQDQAPSTNSMTLGFPRTMVEVRRVGAPHSRCYFPALDREMDIPNEQLYHYKGRQYCFNFTTHRLGVQAGDVLSCCALEPQGMLAIRQGIVGYYRGQYQPLP